MQLTLSEPGLPETAITLSLRAVHYTGATCCPICANRRSAWFADPASDAAMNPSASPIGAGECCGVCLDRLVRDGLATVIGVDINSF